MTVIKRALGGLVLFLVAQWQADAKTLNIEFLEAAINPTTAAALDDLACRNLDHIVHLKIVVDWPSPKIDQEETGFKRLVFWNDKAEFLFPNGTYTFQHGSYIINGYFIPRSGGMHQGVISNYFEKIDDAQVLLNPNVNERKAKGAGC